MEHDFTYVLIKYKKTAASRCSRTRTRPNHKQAVLGGLIMDVKYLMLPGKTVKKSNALARARWSATSILEPRLVALLASQIKKYDVDFYTYEIKIVDLINIVNIENNKHSGQDYKDIEKAVEKLMGRIITIETDTGWKKYTLFSNCELDKENNVLRIGFHPDLKEHYLQLKQYIQYNLLEFMLLPSIYSQRLFEYLKSWDDKSQKIVKISDLHEMLDTPKTFRENFKNFRIRVLEKSHKDINEKTSLFFEWEPIKNGRAVSAIKFKFTKKEKPNSNNSRLTGKIPQSPLAIEQPKNIIRGQLNAFLTRFKDGKTKHLEVGIKYFALNKKGIEPQANDVPENNELGVLEFLKQWEISHSKNKS